jgi:transcriptional regulator with XRE-family HTH domain
MRQRGTLKRAIQQTGFDLAGPLAQAGMSQRQLARELDVDEGHVSKLARGTVRPKWATAVAIARVLKLPLEAFIGPQSGPRRRGKKQAG